MRAAAEIPARPLAAKVGPNGVKRMVFKATQQQARSGGWFRGFAHGASHYLGSPLAFALAVLLVVAWAAAGPFYDFSDSWGLVINTITTIITFLMVFLIQNTQNRDALAIQLKLDELLRALHGARNSLVDLESLSDEQMEHLKNEFARLAHERTEE
jgi:low affinity Fe/Cu permease